MSNLKDIITKLEKSNGKWLNNSKCFKKFVELYNEANFAKEIVTICQNKIKQNKDKEPDFNQQYWNRRNNLTFTKKDGKTRIDSNEVFLERIYSYFQNKKLNIDNHKFHNQYKIGKSCKEAIDIRIDNDNGVEYVELKCLNCRGYADTPLLAIVESIKNYYLSREKEKITLLTILAPLDYWNVKITNENEFNLLIKIIENLNKQLKKENVKIQIKALSIKSSDLNEILKKVNDELEFSHALYQNKQYDFVASVSMDEIWNKISDLEIFKNLNTKSIENYSDIKI